MPKPDLMQLENKHVILRLLEEKDLLLTLSWRNQEHIRKWFVNSDLISEEVHLAWFEKYRDLDTDLVFIIIARDPEEIPVGQVSLYKIDARSLNAEYGRLIIGETEARGRGYARHATELLLQYGFEQLSLQEIYLEVKENNQPAINLYYACGFTEVAKSNGLIKMTITKKAFMKTSG